MYSKFQGNILYSPSGIDVDDRLTFVLFSENVFTVDSIVNTINSFEGVIGADAYIVTKWQYHDHWILEEIESRSQQAPTYFTESVTIINTYLPS